MNKQMNKTNQNGATLAIGLILLLVMTLLGITAMKSTSLQEKMAGGLRNKVLAEGGAESALRAGEDFVWNLYNGSNGVISVADETCSSGVCNWQADNPVEFRKDKNWSELGIEHNYDFAGASGNAGLYKKPRYIIEFVTNGSGGGGVAEFGEGSTQSGESAGILNNYRVTAKSYSGDGKVIEMVESYFTSRSN